MRGEPIPLSAEDRAILDLECDTIVGHTCKVIVLGDGAPPAELLRRRVAERLDAAPQLRWRLGGEPDAPAWVADPDLELDAHVVESPRGEPADDEELRREVAELFAQRLDRDRPLWRLDILPLRGDGAALVWRIHHALADGTTAMRLARLVLFDPGEEPSTTSPHHGTTDAEHDNARRRGHLGGFLEREFGRSHGRSPFDGRIGTTRRIAFARTPLRPLHDAAKSLCGATVNDAVLASVGGGVRRWLEAHHGTLGEVRVKVPVSLHHEGDDAGNRDSFFSVAVPLVAAEPVERLRTVREETSVRKADHDAEALDQLHGELTRLSPHLEGLWSRIERSPRRFALNVSNVPGPRGPVSVLGCEVRELHSLAEIGERHALRIAVVSYAGDLCFGLCSDPAIVDDLDGLGAGIEAEAQALVETAT